MGAQQSSPMQRLGEVNGQTVSFFYRRVEEPEKRQLCWAEGTTPDINATWKKIPTQCMIAVLPVNPQLPDDYSVMYIEEPPASDNKTATPVIFKSIIATNLPLPFITDFTPSGSSCWQLRQDPSTRPNLHVVVSTGSGTGQASAFWEQAVKPMLQHVCVLEEKDYVLHWTSSDSTVPELTRDLFLPHANDGVAQAIVLLSGDGGMVDIINALLSGDRSKRYRKPNITLLPLGTGNALAHSTNITADKTMGLSTMLRGTHKELPLFRASFSPGARLLVNEAREQRPLQNDTAYGAVVCSWGMHATLVADSDTAYYRKFGVERFKMAAKESLFPSDGSNPHPYKGNVSIRRKDSKAWESIGREEHAYILATLVSNLEKGFTISPSSLPLSGSLHLVQFGPMSGEEAMKIMGAAYKGGKHVEDEQVEYDEIEALRIKFKENDARWRRVCVDGKIVLVEEGGYVEVARCEGGVVDLIAMEI